MSNVPLSEISRDKTRNILIAESNTASMTFCASVTFCTFVTFAKTRLHFSDFPFSNFTFHFSLFFIFAPYICIFSLHVCILFCTCFNNIGNSASSHSYSHCASSRNQGSGKFGEKSQTFQNFCDKTVLSTNRLRLTIQKRYNLPLSSY